MKNMRIVSLVLISLFCFAEFGFSQDWDLIWSDEFDQASLDLNTWNIEVNDLGGYNNELQYYTSRPENIRLEDGVLIIEAHKEQYLTREYTSARINSENKKSFMYGKIEARMKLPYGNGMWPAFWMLGSGGGWPDCGEIDIMELVGGNACGWDCGDNKTHGYMHWNDDGLKSAGAQFPPLASGKYADTYHLFGIEWDAQQIKWFVDGVQRYSHSTTGEGLSEFHQPFYFLVNLAVGGDWPGSPDESTVFPQRLYVDYIRVYQKDTDSVPAKTEQQPTGCVLEQNYPNPFNPVTHLNYELFENGHCLLQIYNANGQAVKTLVDEMQQAGVHNITWDGTDNHGNTLPSGHYFYRLTQGSHVLFKSAIFLK